MTSLVPMAGEATHMPTVFTVLESLFPALGHNSVFQFLHLWERQVFSLLAIIGVSLLVIRLSKNLNQRPGKLQNAVEAIIAGFDDFICGFLGKRYGRRFLPYLGTLFIFILVNNWMGLVPFLNGATGFWAATGALAVMTFLLVQYVAMTELGPAKYFHHMCGEPEGIGMWLFGIIMLFPIHLIGEFAKPLSLCLRLYGNIFGEHTLMGVFMGFGVAIAAALGLGLIPIPLHLPFMFLGILMSTIQALIFMLLSMVYILMVLPHDDEEHAH